MTNYKAVLYNHIIYGGIDFLNPDEIKTLSSDIKQRKKDGAFLLPGFNNRASVRETENGFILTSYYTDVAAVIDGCFVKLWHGYSVTTLKHINIFRGFLGLSSISKRDWIQLETETI